MSRTVKRVLMSGSLIAAGDGGIEWLAMIEAGSSLGSFASLNDRLMSGVEAVIER